MAVKELIINPKKMKQCFYNRNMKDKEAIKFGKEKSNRVKV